MPRLKTDRKEDASGYRSTIRQIADECGLSLSTVSRILNRKKNFKCSPKTAKKVFDVAKKYKYLPNRLLGSMRGGHTRCIGVICSMRLSFGTEIIHGIHHGLVANNHVMILEWNDATMYTDGGERESEILHRLLEHRVDGIILAPTNENASELYFREVRERGLPLLLLDTPLTGIDTDFVGTDNFDCGQKAGNFILAQGHRQIFSLIPSGMPSFSFGERVKGFEDAVSNARGIKYRKIEYEQKFEGIQDGKVHFSNNMRKSVLPIVECSQPCLVFCGNDDIAKELYRIVKNAGRRIPDDVSVIGVGNLNFSELMEPPLTSIDQYPFEIGSQAAALMLKRLQEGDSSSTPHIQLRVKCKLVIRDSVKKLQPAADEPTSS